MKFIFYVSIWFNLLILNISEFDDVIVEFWFNNVRNVIFVFKCICCIFKSWVYYVMFDLIKIIVYFSIYNVIRRWFS